MLKLLFALCAVPSALGVRQKLGFSEQAVTATAATGSEVHAASTNTTKPCPEGTVRGEHRIWVGRAPFCMARPSDCTDLGYEYDHSSKSGNGKMCWSGEKVLCVKPTCVQPDDDNPQCTPQLFLVSVVGKAPYCGADECSCFRQQMLPFSLTTPVVNPCQDPARFDLAGGRTTATCWRGTQAICLKPMAAAVTGKFGKKMVDILLEERERCANATWWGRWTSAGIKGQGDNVARLRGLAADIVKDAASPASEEEEGSEALGVSDEFRIGKSQLWDTN